MFEGWVLLLGGVEIVLGGMMNSSLSGRRSDDPVLPRARPEIR